MGSKPATMIFVKSQPDASSPDVQQTHSFPSSSAEFEAALKLMKANILDTVDEKVTEMMTRTEAFESKFKAQEDIIDEMISQFRKETKEARSNINKYQNA